MPAMRMPGDTCDVCAWKAVANQDGSLEIVSKAACVALPMIVMIDAQRGPCSIFMPINPWFDHPEDGETCRGCFAPWSEDPGRHDRACPMLPALLAEEATDGEG